MKKMPKKREIIKSGRYLKLVIRDGWEYVERVNSTGVVIIVSKTDDDKVVLVEQYRRPVRKNVIAFPAGLVGDEHGQRGESLIAAARREMIEETGYLPAKINILFVGPLAAGMCKDMVTLVHARGLKKIGMGGGVGDWEKIKVHEVPLISIDVWLRRQQKKGLLVAPNIYAGIYFLKHLVK